jgi:hypothetical protein
MQYAYTGSYPGQYSAPQTFGNVQMWIPNYSKTYNYKSILSRNASDLNGSGQTGLNISLTSNTNAITSILCAGNYYYAAGTSFSLYGVRTVGQ